MPSVKDTKIYKRINELVDSNNNKKDYINKLDLLEKYLVVENQKIFIYFSEFTAHDLSHTTKVLDYMYDLIDDISKIKIEELMLIAYVGLLHDIGMAFNEDDAKNAIVKGMYFDSLKKKLANKNELLSEEELEKECIREIIRVHHGEYAEKKINDIMLKNDDELPYKDLFILSSEDGAIQNFNLTDLVANICRSHQESVEWVKAKIDLTTNISGGMISGRFVAYLLRLADILDIDCKRASEYYQWSYVKSDKSKSHFALNRVVSTAQKIFWENETACDERCPNIKPETSCPRRKKYIEFNGTYPHMDNERDSARLRQNVDDYILFLESEIKNVNSELQNLISHNFQYDIKLDDKVRNRISDTQQNKASSTIIRLSVEYPVIRELFSSEKLYANKKCGLREIIQNAYDACKAYKALGDVLHYMPSILITYNTEKEILSIFDNGIGMEEPEISKYFLTMGKSIYNNAPKYLYSDYHRDHIGHFGLGFFASFMLSDDVTVNTKYFTGSKIHRIHLSKRSSSAVVISSDNVGAFNHGTEIILNLKHVKKALKKTSDTDLIEFITDYIRELFLDDGISVMFTADGAETKTIDLKKLGTNTEYYDISKYLKDVDAYVSIKKRMLPDIYLYKNSLFEKVDIKQIYDGIIANSLNSISFLDAGSFYIMSFEKDVLDDFLHQAQSRNNRRNYTHGLNKISGSINKNMTEFCKENDILMEPKFSHYFSLSCLREGYNVAFYHTVDCTEVIQREMRAKDACGNPSQEDSIYLRFVRLPKLHIQKFESLMQYDIEDVQANIRTMDVFPTLQRDTLDSDKKYEFSFAIGKAILKLMIEHPDFASEKVFAEMLLRDRYKESNSFID